MVESTNNRNKLLLISSLLVELSGFRVILQGQALDGLLLVMFGMSFCVTIVGAESLTPRIRPADHFPENHHLVRNALLNNALLSQLSSAARWRQRP